MYKYIFDESKNKYIKTKSKNGINILKKYIEKLNGGSPSRPLNVGATEFVSQGLEFKPPPNDAVNLPTSIPSDIRPTFSVVQHNIGRTSFNLNKPEGIIEEHWDSLQKILDIIGAYTIHDQHNTCRNVHNYLTNCVHMKKELADIYTLQEVQEPNQLDPNSEDRKKKIFMRLNPINSKTYHYVWQETGHLCYLSHNYDKKSNPDKNIELIEYEKEFNKLDLHVQHENHCRKLEHINHGCAVVWNADKYKLIHHIDQHRNPDPEIQKFQQLFRRSSPWVLLEDKKTEQKVMVLSIHGIIPAVEPKNPTNIKQPNRIYTLLNELINGIRYIKQCSPQPLLIIGTDLNADLANLNYNLFDDILIKQHITTVNALFNPIYDEFKGNLLSLGMEANNNWTKIEIKNKIPYCTNYSFRDHKNICQSVDYIIHDISQTPQSKEIYIEFDEIEHKHENRDHRNTIPLRNDFDHKALIYKFLDN